MKKNKLVSFYVLINYILCFVNLFFDLKIVSYLNIVVGGIAFIFLLYLKTKNKHEDFWPIQSIVFSIVLVFLMTFNILIVGNYTIGSIFGVFFSYCVLAFYLLKYEVHRTVCYVVFYSFVLLVILVLTGAIHVAQVSWGFFANTSRNYVSFFLIYSLFPLCISCSIKKEPLPLIPLIIVLVLSVFSVGRGGIVMAAIMFVFSLFARKSSKRKAFYFALKTLVVFAIIFFIVRQDILATIVPRFFSSGSFEITDAARLEIWDVYLQNASSPLPFVFGYNSILSTSVFANGNGNLHNSFLQLHTNVGIIGLLLFLIFIINSILCLLKHKEYQLIVYLLVVLVKGAVDLTFGFYYGDVIVVFFVLYPFYKCFRKTKYKPNLSRVGSLNACVAFNQHNMID